MAVAVNSLGTSLPVVAYLFSVTGLVSGANAITLPAPSLQGSFPSDWTPTQILCWVEGNMAAPPVVAGDPATITNTGGQVGFTLNASASFTGTEQAIVMVS